VAIGDTEEMKKAIDMLSEFKESIINSYEIKTGQSRTKISHWMDAETWMNANKAIELGFADGILEDEKRQQSENSENPFAFSRRAVTNSLLSKMQPKAQEPDPPAPAGVPAEPLLQRLNLISH